jgi:RND family efflux transporter MFP subunit
MKIETLPPTPIQSIAPKRRWKAPLIGILVVAVAGGGYTYIQAGKGKPAAAAAAAGTGKAAPKQETFELAAGDVFTIDQRELAVKLPLSGSLQPASQATVKSKVSGQVRETTVQEGMSVSAGQVLARLDQADHQARFNQQKAAVDEAQARLSLAKKNNANSAALLKQNYISQTTYDTTQNAVELAEANVSAASAQLDLARIALNDAVIRAPLAGVVSKRHAQAGDKVAPDMPVFTIVSLNQLTLDAQVPASEIPRIKVGQEVVFKVDGFANRAFTGKVARINPTTEAGSRSMLVYITVANTDGVLRGGMFAKGSITTERSAAVPVLPLGALRKEGDKDVVYRINGDTVVSQPVTLGLRNDDEGFAEVSEGLQAGARVVSAKLTAVKPGAKVKLPGAAPAAKG